MLCLTSQPLKTTFLWNWALVENNVVCSCLDGQLHWSSTSFLWSFNSMARYVLDALWDVNWAQLFCVFSIKQN